jgi:hypothetical protein
MRTRSEIMKALADVPGPDRGESLAFEVLLDIRDLLVAQLRPAEVAPVHLEPGPAGTVTACDDQTGANVVVTWDVSKITCVRCLKLLVTNAVSCLKGARVDHSACISREETAHAEAKRRDAMVFQLQNAAVELAEKNKALEKQIGDLANRAVTDAKLGPIERDMLASLQDYLGVKTFAEILPAVKQLASVSQDRKEAITWAMKHAEPGVGCPWCGRAHGDCAFDCMGAEAIR